MNFAVPLLLSLKLSSVTTLLLLALGVPFEFALSAITSNVAEHLRLAGKGRIRPGFAADLLLLDEAGEVDCVIADGEWLVKGKEALRLGVFEPEPSR